MDIVIIFAISIVLCIICFIVGQKTVKHQEQLNNDEILRQRALLQKDLETIDKELQDKHTYIYRLEKEYQDKKQLIKDVQESVQQAHDERSKALDIEYQRKKEKLNEEYENYIEKRTQELDEYFAAKQEDIELLKQEFQKMKDTKIAAIEAARKEREIQEQPDRFCIPMEDAEIHDIEYLNSIMPKLRYPEVLGKCIWSVFFQKKIKTFLTNTLGPQDICGIYKITDRITQESYIGQSKNIQKRWTDHLKCGVGASPASNANQLYAAMKRDGVWNFSFELLEECLPEELDDKERYFIDLYVSDIAGLNSKRGNQSTLSKEKNLTTI